MDAVVRDHHRRTVDSVSGFADVRRGSRGAETELLVAAAAWSAVVFVVALIAGTNIWGYGVLYFAAIPATLTLIVHLLLRVSRALGHPAARIAAMIACCLVALAVMLSFVIPAFALLPACALLIVACARPATI